VGITLATAQINGTTPIAAGDRSFAVRSINDLRAGQLIVVGTGTSRELRRIEAVSGTTLTVDRAFANSHSTLDPVFRKQLRVRTYTCWPIDGISEPSTQLTTDAGTTYIDAPERFGPEAIYF